MACRTIWRAITGGLRTAGIWLFEHQFIINAILFGQYDKLLNKTLTHVDMRPEARLLQLTCVYGKLTPELLSVSRGDVHLCDVAAGQA